MVWLVEGKHGKFRTDWNDPALFRHLPSKQICYLWGPSPIPKFPATSPQPARHPRTLAAPQHPHRSHRVRHHDDRTIRPGAWQWLFEEHME